LLTYPKVDLTLWRLLFSNLIWKLLSLAKRAAFLTVWIGYRTEARALMLTCLVMWHVAFGFTIWRFSEEGNTPTHFFPTGTQTRKWIFYPDQKRILAVSLFQLNWNKPIQAKSRSIRLLMLCFCHAYAWFPFKTHSIIILTFLVLIYLW